MRKIQRVSEKAVASVLAALEGRLLEHDYARSGVVLSRVREPGVFHMLEVVKAPGGFAINAGISFEEVLQFAIDAGDDWYLYVGEEPAVGRVTTGTCQLIGNVAQLAGWETEVTWTRDELQSDEVIASILDTVTQHVMPALEPLGTRIAFVQKWNDHILPRQARMAVEVALREQRAIPEWVESLRKKLRSNPERTGLTFWGTPAVNAAIVARRLGQLETARSTLLREIESYGSEKPMHVAHLHKVYERLGL